MNSLITWLYALVPITSGAGWRVWIFHLTRDSHQSTALSISTWAIWSVTVLVSLLYAVFVINDMLLIITLSVNAAGQVIVLGFYITGRVLAKPDSPK